MFRSIGGSLENKKKQFMRAEDKSLKIRRVFDRFMRENFGGFKCDVSYDPSNGRAVIKTGNKVIANEISLRLRILAESFKKENIPLTQIIIR